jgi:colicin import membrane protein
LTTATMPPSPLLGRRERLWPTIAVSLLVHAVVVGAMLWRHPVTLVDLNQKPIVARLVRLGETRPKEFLPRKDAAPPPGPVAATPPAPEPPKAAPPPKADALPPPKAAPAKPAAAAPKVARAEPQQRPGGGGLASALSRISKEQKVYGSPDGDARGDADEGEAGDQYLALVTRALQETYNLPATISDKERLHLRATVVLFIEPDGRIARHQFESRSGNPMFDSALERAIRDARLPPPPAEMRARYRTQGLAVLYRP